MRHLLLILAVLGAAGLVVAHIAAANELMREALTAQARL